MPNSRTRPARSLEIEAFSPFSRLSHDVLDLLVAAMKEQAFAPGEALVTQGEHGDYLLVVLDGKARALLEQDPGTHHELARFARGSVVGEMALVTDAPRNATVVATTPLQALRLDAAPFRELALKHPEVAVVLMHMVADRLGHQRIDGLGGKTLGGYVVLRTLARGGMSVVYEARDTESATPIALKMMSHRLIYDPQAAARFSREAEILLALDHPNIARVYQHFQAYMTHFIAMEYCDGPDLGSLIAAHAPLPEDEVRLVLGQIATALCYLRDGHVIHRDLKPDNVLSMSDGTLKLTDFGLAKPLDWGTVVGTTSDHSVMGTPLYMSPEQITGDEIDGTIDVYALGCIAYELLTGAPLFTAEHVGQLMVQKLAFVLPEDDDFAHRTSPDLHAFLRACLALSPADRRPDLDRAATWAAPLPPALR